MTLESAMLEGSPDKRRAFLLFLEIPGSSQESGEIFKDGKMGTSHAIAQMI